MTLRNDGHGHIHAEGEARERLGSKTFRDFEFEVDSATLLEVAHALIVADRAEWAGFRSSRLMPSGEHREISRTPSKGLVPTWQPGRGNDFARPHVAC